MENPRITELIKVISAYVSEKDTNLILKALDYSKKAHLNQKRISGEPYINHPVAVSKILAGIKLDTSSIICGLLHDTVEDTNSTIDDLKKIFGSEIANLVDGLTKINKFSLKVNNLKLGENYRKLLLASTKDLRVILIKLADRLHNMRTLSFLDNHHKKIRIALETLEIYAPLAQRLGMRDWQDQLEDLSFSYINPEARTSILERLGYLDSKDQNIINDISVELKKLF